MEYTDGIILAAPTASAAKLMPEAVTHFSVNHNVKSSPLPRDPDCLYQPGFVPVNVCSNANTSHETFEYYKRSIIVHFL